jgi:predicted DNA-binding transcriptional regulator AlpA
MSFRGGMPKPLPRVPHVESPFVLRAELLTVVPHSMATIDRLEAKGQFPRRIRLEPTTRVGWLRREVAAYLRRLATRRHSAAQVWASDEHKQEREVRTDDR